MASMEWKTDCRFFLGERPCRYRRVCAGCPHYSPFDTRLLIIKLAALGDVLRTTPLLAGLKAKYPGSQITWVSRPGAVEMLRGIESIDRLMVCDLDTIVALSQERFDGLYCFDKEPLATGLAMSVEAEARFGFGRNPHGALIPLNEASGYAYELGLDDELKFRKNTLTYPQIVFEMAELPYRGEEYQLVLRPEEREWAQAFASRAGLAEHDLVIGINTGCGPAFQMKKWTVDNIVGFIDLLGRELDCAILLYGGPAEAERNRLIANRVRPRVVDTGCDNSLHRFSALVDLCDVLVTGDTLAQHLGIALKKHILLLIGSTSWTEIDLFGRGQKVVTDMDCAPCYKRVCDFDPWCLQEIGPEKVFQALLEGLPDIRARKGSRA